MKTQKNQKGVAHLMLVAVVVVLATAIGGAVWRIGSGPSSGVTEPHVDKQAQSACLKQIGDANLCRFAASFSLDTSYVATAAMSGSSSDGTMTIKTDGKGNTSLSSNAGGQQLDSVTIGNNTYIKDTGSGIWLKYTSDGTNSADSSNPADNLKISASNLTDGGNIIYKPLGKEACGSKICYKYEQTDKTSASVTQYIWFDDKDYQLQRFIYADPTTGTIDMSFNYQKVTISVPSPVQDANSGSASSGAASSADVQAAIKVAQGASAADSGTN